MNYGLEYGINKNTKTLKPLGSLLNDTYYMFYNVTSWKIQYEVSILI